MNNIEQEEKKLPEGLEEAAYKLGEELIPIEAGEALSLDGDFYESEDKNWGERFRFIQGFRAGAEWGVEHTKQKPELVQHPAISYMYNADAGRGEQMKQAVLALLKSNLIQVAGRGFTKTELIEWVETRPAETKEDKDESTR